MRRHGEGGFTLMELMIVVAIIGILGGVAIPAYLGYLEKARVARSIAEIRYIEKSVKLFYVTTDRYPLSLGEVSADNIRDPWGTPYQYLIAMGVAAAEYPKPSVVAHTQSSSLWSWFIPSSAHATLNSSNATNHGQASKQAGGQGGGQGSNSGPGGPGNSGQGRGNGNASQGGGQNNAAQAGGGPGNSGQGSGNASQGGGQSDAGGGGNAGNNSMPTSGIGPRKDRFGTPLNSDFDLYSMGKNRETADSLATPKSYDDIVRASDGIFVGLASDF